ncbi:endolytic transglycosylase MltG [Alkalibacillus almallahensis]|uniref:endolytic transglycosylase MltG n=1 Tax=Alkalibacillus almallahensis TaxID=1379154 RepID=UPI001420F1D6|nr:endolytic transglycosylase MltG [Alkalibacillus almallahensis]NIK13385.1 CO dehydrogenase/acetyl-CoA synthase beta subunit [Alkalibacillus almallahensis]
MKPIVMSFSLGLLLSTVIIGVVYLIEIDNQAGAETMSEMDSELNNEEGAMTEDKARSFLEEQDHVVLKSSKYEELTDLEKNNEQLNDKISQLEKRNENSGSSQNVEYELVIEQGMGLEEVASQLHEENIIEDQSKLKEYFRENDYSRSIQTGSFIVTPNMSLDQIAITMTN